MVNCEKSRTCVMTSDEFGFTANQKHRKKKNKPCARAGRAPARLGRAASSCQTGSRCLRGRRSGPDHRTSAAGGSQSAAGSSSPSSTSSFCARGSLRQGSWGRRSVYDKRTPASTASSNSLAVWALAVALASERSCCSRASCSCRFFNCSSNSSSSSASGSAST